MIKSKFAPYAARVLTSQRRQHWFQWPKRIRNRFSSELPRVEFFHQFDDPYSALALEMVSRLLKHYRIAIDVHLVTEDGYPKKPPAQWSNYRLLDARRLAQAWSFEANVLARAPTNADIQQCLRSLPNVPAALRTSVIVEMTQALWQGNQSFLRLLPERFGQTSLPLVEERLKQAHDRRAELGHYQSGTWHFCDTWYLGLDRLEYLEDDLFRWGLAALPNTLHSKYFRPKALPELKGTHLDVFFSFRSPYSYLALARLNVLRNATEGLRSIRLRPVLPMVQRGVTLSEHKQSYILNDAARTAKKLQIPFGFICDPLGPAIDKCLALFYHAREHRLEHRFVNNVMRGIWSEGKDLSSDKVLEKLCDQTGLPWKHARHHLESVEAQAQAHKNQQQLDYMGLWGVPTFAVTDTQNNLETVFWGQDRLPWVEYGFSLQDTV